MFDVGDDVKDDIVANLRTLGDGRDT